MKNLITTFMVIMFSVLTACAAEDKLNVLNSIQIDALKDTYSITLNTKSKTDVKRTIQSQNNMILTIKNIKPSKSLNTIYKNAAEVSSVTVEPINNNSLRIIIQAENISNSAVTVEATETELEAINNKSVITVDKKSKEKKDSSEKIVLSAPVNAYAPVYNDIDSDEDIDDEDFKFTSLGAIVLKIKETLSHGNLYNIVSTGLIGLILFCGIKLFKREETEPVVGLSQSLKDRELNLYKNMAKRNAFTNSVYSDMKRQMNPVQNGLQTPIIEKPSINVNAGYGMKAYQTSSKSPYMSADTMLKRSIPVQNMMNGIQPSAQSMLKQQSTVMPQAKTVTKPKNLSTLGSRVNNNINRPAANQMQTKTIQTSKASNIDSLKFLESMTQIYERNGRSDLAQGLKSGMLKARTSV